MADNVNLNYPSFGEESYIDYIWPILFPNINLDNTVGSSRLLNNAFGTWIGLEENNEDYESLSATDVILDLSYTENNLNLNISFNAQVVEEHDLIFNGSFYTSISHEFDTWRYLASNPDLISSIGTDKGRVAQHYFQIGINEGRTVHDFNAYDYVASNQDLIPIFGLNPKEAVQHYVEFGFNEQRLTSPFNESVYLAANLDIINLDYSSSYRYEIGTYFPWSELNKHAQNHYINFGYLEGRNSNLNTFLQAVSGKQTNFNSYSNSVLSHYNYSARQIVSDYVYFDYNSYLASNLDLLDYPGSKLELYHHYLFFGRDELRSLDSFDEYKYLVANHDLIKSFGSNGKLATKHYVESGFFEGRNLTPSSEFNIFLSGYLVSNPDVLDSLYKDVDGVYNLPPGINDLQYSNLYANNTSGYDYSKHSSLTHYFENGYLENRQFNSFNNSNYLNYLTEKGFNYLGGDGESYFNKYNYNFTPTNFLASDYEAIASHFIYDYVYFDDCSYLASNTDLILNLGINSKFNIFNHYINHGYTEQRSLDDFDEYQYLASYHDLILSFGLNNISSATEHYVQRGYLEGRNADNFNEWGYVASYTDLLTVIGKDTSAATVHYISFGMLEGRRTDIFNPDGYLNKNSDLRSLFGNNHYEATKHYVEYGFAEGRVF